jgi:hypothetical protein
MGTIPANRRLLGLGLQAALSACVLVHAPLLAADEPPILRVRSTDMAITGFIDLATTRSLTFRHLVALIQASDGIVHVEPGECGHGTRACLKVWMVSSGSNRFLRVLVNRRRADSDVDFMGSIGHELQHTLEALSEPNTVNSLRLYSFFSRTAPTAHNRFETVEAIHAGDAVREELSSFRPR